MVKEKKSNQKKLKKLNYHFLILLIKLKNDIPCCNENFYQSEYSFEFFYNNIHILIHFIKI
jgi:hypothetical protein